MSRCLRSGAALALALGLLAFASTSSHAQTPPTPTFDPARHFRGGAWEQWLLWITPGPDAQAAIVEKVAQVNVARAAAQLPALNYFGGEFADPLIVAFYEEHDPRGPDGAPLVDRTPNREMFFGTFVDDGVASYVLFFDDPIRSNAELTAKGVPGQPGNFEWKLKSEVRGSAETRSTNWKVTSALGDKIRFSASYESSDFSVRSRNPSTASYLAAGMGLSVRVMYASRPTAVYAFYERSESAIMFLADVDAEVELEVRHHHDPLIDRMTNDPENVEDTLFEFRHRIVRLEAR